MSVLLDYIESYTSKVLAHVDLPNRGSHQHELNGSKPLRDMLGSEKLEGSIAWSYVPDDGQLVQTNGTFTFYDARAKSSDRTGRSEWRFYYDQTVLNVAGVGDLLVLLRLKGKPASDLIALVFPANSTRALQARLIFDSSESSYLFAGQDELERKKVGFAESYILDLLGIDSLKVQPDVENILAENIPGELPSTKVMASIIQQIIPSSSRSTLDELLIDRIDLEERVFKAWERREVQKRLSLGFDDVDHFVKFSLSVHNRRKSRMGYSLENHLENLLTLRGIEYSVKATTENGYEPDFLFPGVAQYNQAVFPSKLLTMLGAKSTLKDRWRQILSEADRIEEKHLCTLEPAISVSQTSQISHKSVVLVIPQPIHHTYNPEQRSKLLTLEDFFSLVLDRQRAAKSWVGTGS